MRSIILLLFVSFFLFLTINISALHAQDNPHQDGRAPPPVGGLQCTDCHVGSESCSFCHTDIYNNWVTSAHKDRNIDCRQCHSGAETIPHVKVKRSFEVCGSCHEEIYRAELGVRSTCGICHNPHSLSFEAPIPNLCEQCHGMRYRQWSVSAHSEEQITCESCHTHSKENSEVHRIIRSESSSCGAENCHANILSLEGRHPLNCTDCHSVHSLTLPTNSVPQLCQECHEDLYALWSEGAHGKPGERAKCTLCHNPHAPYIAGIPTLPPPTEPPSPAISKIPLLSDVFAVSGRNTTLVAIMLVAIVAVVVISSRGRGGHERR